MELGLALTPVHGGLQSILLYYTDSEQPSHSRKAAAFTVPDMTEQWTRFTVSESPHQPHILHQRCDVKFYVCARFFPKRPR